MLRQRIITGVIIAPIALACVFLLPPFYFSLFVGAVLVVAAWEWGNLGELNDINRIIYAVTVGLGMAAASFVPAEPVIAFGMAWWLIALFLVYRFPKLEDVWGEQPIVLALGFWIMIPGWAALDTLKQLPDSAYLISLLFLMIWGADIGAYFSGRTFGQRKLAPNVSPGKSWEGVIGGVVTSVVIAVLMSLWYGAPSLSTSVGLAFLLTAVLIALISVLGDLTMSMFKRHRGVKDSSNLLPGHGGFLDRIDSLLSATPAFTLYLVYASWMSGN